MCRLDGWEINHGKVHGERTGANYSRILRKIAIFNDSRTKVNIDR